MISIERAGLGLLLATFAVASHAANPPPAPNRAARQTGPAKTAAPCLTKTQMNALLVYALPSVIDGMGKTCRISLPADAYLSRSGATLADRYRAESKASWPAARAAFQVMSGDALPPMLDENVEQSVLSGIIAGAISSEIKAKDCGAISEVIEVLAPLPVDNLARLTTLLIGLASKDKGDEGSPFRLCPAIASGR